MDIVQYAVILWRWFSFYWPGIASTKLNSSFHDNNRLKIWISLIDNYPQLDYLLYQPWSVSHLHFYTLVILFQGVKSMSRHCKLTSAKSLIISYVQCISICSHCFHCSQRSYNWEPSLWTGSPNTTHYGTVLYKISMYQYEKPHS